MSDSWQSLLLDRIDVEEFQVYSSQHDSTAIDFSYLALQQYLEKKFWWNKISIIFKLLEMQKSGLINDQKFESEFDTYEN